MARPDLVIISDLHLCDGGPREDFLDDDERDLVRLLADLGRQTPTELMINGDFIDFIQIQPRPYMWAGNTLDASEQESLEKLELALAAHAPTLDGLAQLAGRGATIRFNYGNHDIDLVWPAVQRRLKAQLGVSERDPRIVFGWSHTAPGVYIEHGQQADPANSFGDMRTLIHTDPQGIPRLERPWGTRLVEEFFNRLEEIDGLEMLDNVRPRLRAAAIIISYGLRHPLMYPALRRGIVVVLQALAVIQTDRDVELAAGQLGVSPAALHLIVAAAGFLGLLPPPAPAPARQPGAMRGVAPPTVARHGLADEDLDAHTRGGRMQAPTLDAAYRLGQARSGDPIQLEIDLVSSEAAITPNSAQRGAGSAPDAPGRATFASGVQQRYIQRAARIAQARRDIQAICFGHTHLATDARVRVDDGPGWPLPGTACRYYNSGSWTRSLNLSEPRWSEATFDDLRDPANYWRGRELIRIRWPHDDAEPILGVERWPEA